MSALPPAAGIDLSGRVAVVTGATRGIGRAVAAALKAAGCVTVGVARRVDGDALAADVSREEDVRGLADHVARCHGRADVVVNCAGINVREPLRAVTAEHFDAVLGTNLRGTLLVMQAMVPLLEAAGGGSIINMTSLMAHVGNPFQSAYAASKGAVAMLTRVAAVELGPLGIRVNAVTPGYIDTPLTRALWAHEPFRRHAVAHTPLGRLGTPEDVVGAVLFLASSLSAFVTGQILVVDGGYLAGDPQLVPPWSGPSPQADA